MSRDTGGPAFPSEDYFYEGSPQSNKLEKVEVHHNGMTLRDWFAGKAICAVIGKPSVYDDSLNKWVAIKAYEIADAMLAERDK